MLLLGIMFLFLTHAVADPDSDDDMNGSGSPPEPVSCPTSDPTNNAGNNPIGGDGPDLGFDNIYNITYTSFLIGFVVSVVVAFFLFVTVMGMGMSMLPGSRKCLKKVCCCCCNKKKELKNKNFKVNMQCNYI